MKTVSSDRNLLIWKRNKNGSNIELPVLGGDEYYLRGNYAHLFRTVAETLKAKKVASFVRLWLDLVNSECSAVEKRIRESAKEFKPSKSAVELVVNKFRGNCGEILVETLAENGLLSNICKPGTYEPVDPDNEKFIDAEGVRNGMRRNPDQELRQVFPGKARDLHQGRGDGQCLDPTGKTSD